MEKTILTKFETFDGNEEENIRYAWDAFTVSLDKQRGLWYAYNAKQFLDAQPLNRFDEGELLKQIYKRGLGYHVVAMLYLWNNWFDEAFEIDCYFLNSMHVENSKECIDQYLEMLMVKRQPGRLAELFDQPDFKKAFLNHYDVYHSIFIDPGHNVTDMNDFVPLINKVNKLSVGYGEKAIYKEGRINL